MTNNQLNEVNQRIEWEGFDYAFINYSKFPQIDDPEFHKLREDYVKAHDALWGYLKVDEFNEIGRFEEDDDESE